MRIVQNVRYVLYSLPMIGVLNMRRLGMQYAVLESQGKLKWEFYSTFLCLDM